MSLKSRLAKLEKQAFSKWTTIPPTVSGWYWIRVKREGALVTFAVYADYFDGYDGKKYLRFDFPTWGYDQEDEFYPPDVAYWFGPVQPPAPPKG